MPGPYAAPMPDPYMAVSEIPTVLTDELRAQLAAVSTATLTHQLQMRGIRSTFLTGLKPTRPELPLVGRARTLRYVALREDVKDLAINGRTAQKHVVETVQPGDVVVMEARGIPDAGTIGDIFALRVKALGGAGVITDGALRDTPAITAIELPVYHQSSHAATYGRQHMPYSVDDAITCAGVFIRPGDIVVGDAEGAVVVPHALAAEVAADAVAQEEVEEFAIERIREGESTDDLFPLAKSRRPEFEQWKAQRS
jgi:5-oxopent-3-ene-1,2,5-tricarboxylate decarboxylase/2-hydroxyhepta-2,4-diene-1,7-dioate isomerase